MEIREIKQYLKERGINPDIRLERNGGGQFLFNLLFEFNNIVKRETKKKIMNKLESFEVED